MDMILGHGWYTNRWVLDPPLPPLFYRRGGGLRKLEFPQFSFCPKSFVCDLFGVFKDLCRYTLGLARAHCLS